MQPEVIAAFITAIFSLIVALASLVSAWLTNRQAARASESLEALKHDLIRKGAAEDFGTQYLGESLRSLQLLICDIQRVKDDIQLILSAVDTSLRAETAVQRLGASREKLFEAYEEHLANLSEDERTQSHSAKNLALLAEQAAIMALEHKPYASNLADSDRVRLTDLRNRLSDCQDLLRDSRVTRLVTRTARTS